MPDRRTFLWQASGALALGSLGLSGLACASREVPAEAGAEALDEIGLQLYTVRNPMEEDAEEAGLEYAFVEHDQPEDPLQSIRTSYQHLEQLTV